MSDNQLEQNLDLIFNEAKMAIEGAGETQALYNQKVQFLGKSGKLSLMMREMKNLPAEKRPQFGQKVNELKAKLEEIYLTKEENLKKAELAKRLESERIDMTLPGPLVSKPSSHPVWKVIDEITDIFSRIGFSVRLGPLIEKDFYNFEALNIPANHPSRDMQDTFYIDDTHVLRTHTSPVQIHTMEKEKPPIRILAPGAVFRCDNDISHLPMFHQVEGLYIDEKVSMADLKGVLAYFSREFFGKNIKTRFRPSFFPFTEPSAEVDCTCPICEGKAKNCRMCKDSGWIEIGGCGLVHPNVFKAVKLEYPKWQGFAFGMGVERLAIVKYGVEDIRLFIENDMRFLSQFD